MPVVVRAVEPNNEEPVYYDTEQGRFVHDIDDYLVQLNNGMITPCDSITNYESDITPFDLSEPSQECSNIFGHKWGAWTSWSEVSRVHFPQAPCLVTMERGRFCTRTNCSAYQTETDKVWVEVCPHKK